MQVLGFKLNCKEDLETLKNIVPGYKEESHVHELIIPSETAVWNEEDIPPGGPSRTTLQTRAPTRGPSRPTLSP